MNVSYKSMHICNNVLLLDWQSLSFIGARTVNGMWRWDGRVTEPITYEWWGESQPTEKSQYCMGTSAEYKFRNIYCHGQKNFFCERVHNF